MQIKDDRCVAYNYLHWIHAMSEHFSDNAGAYSQT